MGLRVVAGRLTSLRPATEDDAELLAAWHADPDVSRYWDDETFTVEEVRARLERAEVDSWIAEAGGEPVGYLQSWREPEGPLRGGIDMFLVPSARGRGLGPDAGRALALHLLASGWAAVTVDPYLWNEHAVAAWRRAGFRAVEERPADDEHTAPWLLMAFDG
ncbi:MAG: GNAT family N-acetyltransferase [Gaiellaceae bacterium]